jgi:hypothetical protein
MSKDVEYSENDSLFLSLFIYDKQKSSFPIHSQEGVASLTL